MLLTESDVCRGSLGIGRVWIGAIPLEGSVFAVYTDQINISLR
jgi:hypothetical protein